jgi:hypothetical protein
MVRLVGGFYAAGINAKELEDIVLSTRIINVKSRRTIFDITIRATAFKRSPPDKNTCAIISERNL